MYKQFWITTLLIPAICLGAHAQRATLVATYTLPRMSLSQFSNPACTEAVLQEAKTNGLKFTDLPSVGSGLAKAGPDEFWGINDRGPNGMSGGDEDNPMVFRTFPLPQFCPSIFRLKLAGNEIQITQTIPLTDTRGKLISGLSNLKGEERLYETPGVKTPLAYDEDGVDPEGIRVLPSGDFLLSEEYSPSILVVATNGQILMRYTPQSKPLPHATYPVKAILPDIFARRRDNKGFENLALSADGKFAYALLQTPMGSAKEQRYAESRVIRMVKLDVSNPLDAKVVGEYLALESDASGYSAKQKQDKIGWSDADWLAPDRLLVIERGKGLVKLVIVDFSAASNILGRAEESSLALEDSTRDLAALNIRPALAHEIFSTRDLPGITSNKLEGLVILSPTEIALSNDNDFGLGDNTTGEPSRVWLVRLAQPLAFGNGGK
ncbi:MAG TPA: esterase-like activity of phytase family protein [Verrucomicrobiae bacterium]|jgi:alkaline phosphatase|nr:esterase-like activity of phytase family protein [Verrucomicrobiae bacterium]